METSASGTSRRVNILNNLNSYEIHIRSSSISGILPTHSHILNFFLILISFERNFIYLKEVKYWPISSVGFLIKAYHQVYKSWDIYFRRLRAICFLGVNVSSRSFSAKKKIINIKFCLFYHVRHCSTVCRFEGITIASKRNEVRVDVQSFWY